MPVINLHDDLFQTRFLFASGVKAVRWKPENNRWQDERPTFGKTLAGDAVKTGGGSDACAANLPGPSPPKEHEIPSLPESEYQEPTKPHFLILYEILIKSYVDIGMHLSQEGRYELHGIGR